MISKALVVASYRSKLTELAHLGVETIAVVPPSWQEAGRHIMFEPAPDEPFELIRTPIAWNGHYHLHYYPRLLPILRRVKPDVVHVDEEPYNLATYLAIRSARSLRAKALFFAWQNIERYYPPPFSQIERYGYRRADYALAGSLQAARVLWAKGYQGNLEIVPQFGVDIDQFKPKEPHKGPFTIGFLGRLVPEKGVEDLISAFRRLENSSRLIIAGDGPLETRLATMSADMIGQGRIEHRRRVPSKEVPSLLRQLDVAVLPSRATPRWTEQYGRFLIEAMACGVPVIGSDSGEIPEVIDGAGIVFPEGDIDALTSELSRLARSPNERQELGRRGRGRVLAMYSQQSVARRTYEVYRQMVE